TRATTRWVCRDSRSRALRDERVDADGVNIDGLGPSLHQQLSLCLDGDHIVEAESRLLVDQDGLVHDLRMRLETSSDIDGVAHARIGRSVVRARVARHNLP